MGTDPRAAKAIFLEAVDVADPADRAALLDRACGDDIVLRRRVEELLRAHDQPDAMLDRPLLAGAEDDFLHKLLEPSTRPDSLGRLAHYEVQEVVGRGAFGTVLKAFDDRLHRVVAVKVMAPELAASANARQRFLREARAAASVKNENVVSIHDVGESPLPYLVMEYVAGSTLQEKLDQDGALKVAEVLRIGYQTALGLAAAHKVGLVHRDVKPANILLENGVERVKLTDFGLARALDDASLTQSGVVSGTPSFMSPEQAQGQSLDHRSDLFSLGSTLYAMCTGRQPFRAGSTLAVLKRVVEDAPRPIREVNGDIPPELCAIVERLHAKAPDARFASAQEVADLLARCLADLQRPSAPTDLQEQKRTNEMMATPAMMAVQCVYCQIEFSVSVKLAGKKVKCPSCGKTLQVPEAVAKGWYIARDKQKLGPYSPAQLRKMANAGQLRPDDMLLREGQKQWVKASTIKGLFPEPVPVEAAPASPKKKRRGVLFLVIGAVAAFLLLSCGCVASLPVLWLFSRVASGPPSDDHGLSGVTAPFPMTTPWKGTATAPKPGESGPSRPVMQELPEGVIAASGFNDEHGLLSDPDPGSPFRLGGGDRTGGQVEPGWAGPWPKHDAATFQKMVVQEGDGALHLTGSPNFGPNYRRQLAKAQTETFQVEYYVQVSAGSSFAGYVWKGLDGGAEKSGPNWSVRDGKFTVGDGDEQGSVTMLDTGFACKPDTWYKVTLGIDVAKRKWEILVDDKRFVPTRSLGFRSRVDYLDTINFLVEGGVYIDALRVSLVPAP